MAFTAEQMSYMRYIEILPRVTKLYQDSIAGRIYARSTKLVSRILYCLADKEGRPAKKAEY